MRLGGVGMVLLVCQELLTTNDIYSTTIEKARGQQHVVTMDAVARGVVQLSAMPDVGWQCRHRCIDRWRSETEAR